jgi:hypothetical protein
MRAIEKRLKTREEVVGDAQKRIAEYRKNVTDWLRHMTFTAQGTKQEQDIADLVSLMRGETPKNPELAAAAKGKTLYDVADALKAMAKQVPDKTGAYGQTVKAYDKEAIAGALNNAQALSFALGRMTQYETEPITDTTKTTFYKTAEGLGDYWVRPHELFARAFESWVSQTLTAHNQQSDYLVAHAKGGGDTPWSKIYPAGVEAENIGKAMETLVSAIRGFVLQKTVEKAIGRRSAQAFRKVVRIDRRAN